MSDFRESLGRALERTATQGGDAEASLRLAISDPGATTPTTVVDERCGLCGRRSPRRWADRDPVTVTGWFDVGCA